MKKTAVFLGDFFWSSIPYDGIELYQSLQNLGAQVDLLMFEKDIRLNKKFTGNEKYRFDVSVFKSKALKTLKSWNELYSISNDYSLVLSSTHIAPKTRYPSELKSKKKCEFAAWDIGGADILTNAIHFADLYFTKGLAWKKWLQNEKKILEKNVYVTGSPHYDPYLTKKFDKEEFYKKYAIPAEQKTILVCPSNPASHKVQFEQNIKELECILNLAEKNNTKILVKTYPSDYLFYENEEKYSGIYKRIYGSKPQYQFLKDKFPELIIIESQDHFDAIMNCNALFNMSGSHVSWETHFSKAMSYSINLKDKPYYNGVSYIKNFVYPDDVYNCCVENIEDIFNFNTSELNRSNDFILNEIASKKISKIVMDLTC